MNLSHYTPEIGFGRLNGDFVYNPTCSACLSGVPGHTQTPPVWKAAAVDAGDGGSGAATATKVRGKSPADISQRRIIDVHHHIMPPQY